MPPPRVTAAKSPLLILLSRLAGAAAKGRIFAAQRRLKYGKSRAALSQSGFAFSGFAFVIAVPLSDTHSGKLRVSNPLIPRQGNVVAADEC